MENSKEQLNRLRYMACVPALMVIGLITSPLTLLFNWTGFWILFIAAKEGCSLTQAKRLIKEDKRYKVTRIKYTEACVADIEINKPQWSDSPSGGGCSDTVSNPAYSHLPYNIHHKI